MAPCESTSSGTANALDGDRYLSVGKREFDGGTKMQIRLLGDRARVRDAARMLSGATLTETSLQHAAQMIAGSR